MDTAVPPDCESGVVSAIARRPASERMRLELRAHSIRRVIAHLRTNMSERVTLGELAEVARCSPWHLDRLFAGVTGLTPMAFLSMMRIAEAKVRVVTGKQHIIEIAFDVGYRSLGSFGNRFARLVGMSPMALRTAAGRFDVMRFEGLLGVEAEQNRLPEADRPASVTGLLRFATDQARCGGFAFVALFRDAAPTTRPLGCVVVRVPGAFALEQVPRGWYNLLALAHIEGQTTWQVLLQTRALRARRSGIWVDNASPTDIGELVLEPPSPEEPPILPVFPVLLETRLRGESRICSA